jgi:hypothetical protein
MNFGGHLMLSQVSDPNRPAAKAHSLLALKPILVLRWAEGLENQPAANTNPDHPSLMQFLIHWCFWRTT